MDERRGLREQMEIGLGRELTEAEERICAAIEKQAVDLADRIEGYYNTTPFDHEWEEQMQEFLAAGRPSPQDTKNLSDYRRLAEKFNLHLSSGLEYGQHQSHEPLISRRGYEHIWYAQAKAAFGDTIDEIRALDETKWSV